ncbi:hypothetical protein DH2020_007853 [Rehmannia glutinosa]|uniref:Filament-like plant protein n=1 Tax=Rehmannia glutinosa TaxID=99300 RepID=A0ABR0TZD1_REHGL
MEKRKWPWKKKSSERSPGESESSGSFSSHSERYSDEQEVLRESPNDSLQSPEVTSKATLTDDEVKEAVKSLTEKLSAALVNVSAKEDLVKQHAKVAEEAVAGRNEVTALKQQLEVAVQQNLNLEVRASHLDGALKECVRQLRQAKDEQDKRISDAIESAKADLEKQILNLQAEAEAVDPNTLLILQALEQENSSLKQELASRSENASKLQLDSIRKIAKLEAECRRLQSNARKSTPLNNQKSVAASSFYAESLTDSCKSSNTEANGSEQNFSDTWASALISELDQFKNEKPSPKNLAVEIDMMDDFLEMERLAALSETKEKNTSFSEGNTLRGELDSMTQRVDELENKLANIEAEKLELQNALDESVDSLKAAQSKMEELQKEIVAVNETKELLEFQLVGMEVETRTLSANVDSLKEEIEEERKLSAQLTVKRGELENELSRRIQESEVEQNSNSNGELKVKQEDLAVAADKLAECQQTIASLGRQLESLATLEDFLIDTSNIPGFSRGDIWRLPSKDASMENHSHLLANGDDNSLPNHMTAAKSRNGFGKFFSRSKSVLELENIQD